MAVMDYQTQDGLADYGFAIEFHPDDGWRVYIIFEPFYRDQGDNLQLPHQSIDGNGRRYVNWPSKVDSLGEARTVAALWAELVHRYQRTKEPGRVTPRRIVPAGVNRLSDGTMVQQIRFSERDFAVLDISLEVSTVNWTSDVVPGRFVSEIDRIADLADTDPVSLQMSSEPRAYETTMSSLRKLVPNKAFNMACQLVRIDLSYSRSVAWQTLPSESGGLMVAGMGEFTGKIDDSDSRMLLSKLLRATATSKVSSQKVTSSLADLVEFHLSELIAQAGRQSGGQSA